MGLPPPPGTAGSFNDPPLAGWQMMEFDTLTSRDGHLLYETVGSLHSKLVSLLKTLFRRYWARCMVSYNKIIRYDMSKKIMNFNVFTTKRDALVNVCM